MKTFKFLTAMTAIGIAMTLYSCEGKQGATGPTGTNGTNGTNGNANVSTYNFTENPSDWTKDNDSGWVASFTPSGFNPTEGAICIYLSLDSANWNAIPITVSLNSVLSDISYSFSAGTIRVNIDPITPNAAQLPAITHNIWLKIVAIPPAAINLHPNTNWKDYSQVQAIIESQNVNKN